MQRAPVEKDNCTRRAFALDSRTTWVETKLDKNNFFTRIDNLPLGPGEYSPSIMNRHISTPSLAPSHFSPFKSSISRAREDARRQTRMNDPNYSPDLREGKTIFHNADMRHPYDPHLNRTKTPGSYLTHDEILSSVSISGKKSAPRVNFGGHDNIPFGERLQYKTALPDYSVNYDSKHLRKDPRLLTISPTIRFKHYATQYPEKDFVVTNKETSTYSVEGGNSLMDSSVAKGGHIFLPSQQPSAARQPSVSPIKKPYVSKTVIRVRTFQKLQFDASSYDKLRKPEAATLCPSVINKQIKLNNFGGVLTVPKLYASSKLKITTPS